MTDLRRAAEENGALTRFENGEECVDPMFEKGWLAASEKATLAVDESMSHLKYALSELRIGEELINEERARSAELNERLKAISKAISRRVTSGQLEYGYSDLLELADWADRAIAEYEASRD